MPNVISTISKSRICICIFYFIFVYVSCIYDNDIRYTKIYDSYIHDYSPKLHTALARQNSGFIAQVATSTFFIQNKESIKICKKSRMFDKGDRQGKQSFQKNMITRTSTVQYSATVSIALLSLSHSQKKREGR